MSRAGSSAVLLAAMATCAEPKKCFFLHGAGCPSTNFVAPLPRQCPNPPGAPGSGAGFGEGPMTASFPEYWGDLHLKTRNCDSFHFNHEDTITQSFDSLHLRERTCQQLCGGPGCVVTDAVVFTHSMGNLYLASALAHGDCHLGASADWYLSNPPALGSHAAKIAEDMCHSGLFRCPLVVPGSCEIARQVFMEMGICTGPDEHHLEPTPMIRSLDPAFRGLNGTLQPDAMLAVMEQHASGGMCGVKPHGLKCRTKTENDTHNCAVDGVGLWAISLLSFPLKPSDGMVPLDSCEVRGQNYVADWKDSWYLLSGNHEDGTCRNGDDPTGPDRQPCRWYDERVADSVRKSASARFSCPAMGSAHGRVSGCVRNDSAGAFDSEETCLRHCLSCAMATTSPCENGGRCIPPRSWSDEAGLERGYDCACAPGFGGELCSQRSPTGPSKSLISTSAAKQVGEGLLVLVALLMALAAVSARRRRSTPPSDEPVSEDFEARLTEPLVCAGAE